MFLYRAFSATSSPGHPTFERTDSLPELLPKLTLAVAAKADNVKPKHDDNVLPHIERLAERPRPPLQQVLPVVSTVLPRRPHLSLSSGPVSADSITRKAQIAVQNIVIAALKEGRSISAALENFNGKSCHCFDLSLPLPCAQVHVSSPPLCLARRAGVFCALIPYLVLHRLHVFPLPDP